MKTEFLPVLMVLPLLAACDNDKPTRLPPAKKWSKSVDSTASNPHGAFNPHGGTDPHAGLAMGGDPHAGLAMGANPHAGMDMEDPRFAGLAAPDPNRRIDPGKYLRGTLTLGAGAKVPNGAVLFLSVRPIDKATGTVLGQPLAVDKLPADKFPLAFELTEEHMMVAGTAFNGDVQIYARIDQDGEASQSQPGDIEGDILATIPAQGVQVELSRMIQ